MRKYLHMLAFTIWVLDPKAQLDVKTFLPAIDNTYCSFILLVCKLFK